MNSFLYLNVSNSEIGYVQVHLAIAIDVSIPLIDLLNIDCEDIVLCKKDDQGLEPLIVSYVRDFLK
jgi:hypothetical protein